MLSTATIGLGPTHELDQARDLGRADDLVGEQDVADPRRGHDFGLAKLGAGDADGAGRKLPDGRSEASSAP